MLAGYGLDIGHRGQADRRPLCQDLGGRRREQRVGDDYRGEQEVFLDDVRAKFTKDAELWLYVCHGGVDPMLLQNISNTFQIKVKAFSKVIVFCAPSDFPANRQHRVNVLTGTKPSDSCPGAVADFHQLASDRGASPKLP